MTIDGHKSAAESRGDKERQLAALYEEYYKRIARYAYARTGDKTGSEDIANEVFLKALESLKNYQERGLPMQAWLFKIAHNLLVDHLRRASKYKMMSLEKADMTEAADPAVMAETSLEMKRVNQAMENLTEDQREVVRLRFFGGLTSGEVAGLMNKSDGAVREMQRAALEKLRQMLK